MRSAPKGTWLGLSPISKRASTPKSDQKRPSNEAKLSFDLLIKIHLSKIIIQDKTDAIINKTMTDLTIKLAFKNKVKIEVSIIIRLNFSFPNIISEVEHKE